MPQLVAQEPLYVGSQTADENYTTAIVIVANCPNCSHTTAKNGTCPNCKPYQDVDCLGCLKQGEIPSNDPLA